MSADPCRSPGARPDHRRSPGARPDHRRSPGARPGRRRAPGARPVTAVGLPGAPAQLRGLLALRWRMVRTPGVQLAICLSALALVELLVLAGGSSGSLPAPALATVRQLAPQAFLGFGVLAVIAPLTAGGGHEVVPPDQLVAFPVRPRTQFLGGLVLAPVNLVWVLQLLLLVAVTGALTTGRAGWSGAVTSAAYVVALTVVGQAIAWAVAGSRQTRRGRLSVAVLACLALVTAVMVVKAGRGPALLRHSPTRTVVRAVADGPTGRWALTTAVLLLLVVGGLALGARACAWALRRPGDSGATSSTRAVRRRRAYRSALRELVAVDRASAWRAPALRRGALVLAVLPGLVAAGAAVPWESLVVLPGLVAAGAGLLFGVNAFCLDGSGALWLASLPHDPRLVLRAKTVVLTETVTAAAVLAGVSGSMRSPGLPTAAELTAVISGGVACTALVVATCLSLSVRRPHRADLAGPRDAVAPSGALALASARLALPTGLVGLALEGAARTGVWALPLLLALPVLALSAWSARRSLSRYDNPVVRARIVSVVSAG